ncbi:MAG: fumarate reductase subunit C [Motiliproteus sp.]|jgi:fumarate reductase subunit C
MNSRLEIKLWLIHRLSAMVLGLFVVIHLVTMIVVIQGGLSSEEIMTRTQGSYLIGSFYLAFIIAAALHGSIGLRTVAQEVIGWKGTSLNVAAAGFCVLLCIIGFSAIKGLVL